jgi:predicted Na+-dependent transporter
VLIPLAVDLFIKACYADSAASLQPMMVQTSSTALMILIVLMLMLNFDSMPNVIATGAIIVLLLFIALTFQRRWWSGHRTSKTLT